MKYEDSIKKILVGLIMVLGAAMIVTVVATIFISTNIQPAADQQQTQISVQKEDLDDSDTIKEFPSNLPLEANARVLQNYNAITSDGRNQFTRVIETKKSLTDNLALYTKFFNDNGWNIKSTVDKETYKSVSAYKGDQQIQVALNSNATTQINKISISLTVAQ